MNHHPCLPLRVFVGVIALTALSAVTAAPAATNSAPYIGPSSGVTISEAMPIVDLAADAPAATAPRELRLVLREAVTLTDIEKQGIRGGGGVREVPVTVYGDITLLIPVQNGVLDLTSATGELNFLGVNRISFRGRLREDPAAPLKMADGGVSGSLIFPMKITEPKKSKPRMVDLVISLDLTVKDETFRYTPDPDPSIPPWRSNKVQPSGNKVTGTWRTIETQADRKLELEGKIGGARGCFRLARTPGKFFPVQAIDLSAGAGGLEVMAFTAPQRVDAHESVWAVRELDQPVDLSKFNGLRLKVTSPPPADGRPVPAVAVAFRVQGQPWFACRTVAPLLGGEQDCVADFDFFMRGTANPGTGGGPNERHFPDLTKIDAIAVGVANPFGAGEVPFTALALEAVRHGGRGAGEAPQEPVRVTVDARVRDVFNGADSVPPGLFGFHLASPTFQGDSPGPDWFTAPPVAGDGMKLLELTRPGLLRPIDHTNFTAETGSSMVHPMPAAIAEKAGGPDTILHTVTNENLWARPKWMDVDPDQYAEGIREMFRQVGKMAWTPEQPENTLRRIEFWNEPFMWARHINRGQSALSAGPGDPGGNRGRKAWTDPTQYTFMPGELGATMYAKFFNAAADGLKETNPHVQIGGMSSGLFSEDFFAQLTNHVAHFLAASHKQIDFLTEHHYSSHAPATAAAYEVITAWSLAKHGKSWPIYNTEANDLDDVAPGDRRSAEAAKAFTDLNRAYFNFRDILELILRSRDKARGRAIHALWGRGFFKNEGEHLMYVHTAALRGVVVPSAGSDPAILPVAAWENGSLQIYLLNDSPFPRATSIEICGQLAPDKITASGLRLAPDASHTGIFPSAFTTSKAGDSLTVHLTEPLAPREIARITVTDVAEPRGKRATAQYYSDLVVTACTPAAPLRGRIALPPDALKNARTARLRIVAGDIQSGEATATLGGLKAALPPTNAEGSHQVIQEISLDPASLHPDSHGELPLEVTCANGRDGFQVFMISLLLEE